MLSSRTFAWIFSIQFNQTSQQEKSDHWLSRWEIDTSWQAKKVKSRELRNSHHLNILLVFRYLVLYTIEFLSFLFNIQLKAFRDAIPSILTNWILLWIGLWYHFKNASRTFANKSTREIQSLLIQMRNWYTSWRAKKVKPMELRNSHHQNVLWGFR